MDRAYSTLEIKSVATTADGKRTFCGIASTPTTDRQGDVVEPGGAQFTLPIPLLWQHDSKAPIGWVTQARVTGKGIEVDAEIANVPDPGRLKDRLDEAWQSIKSRLVRGLSIGFQAISVEPLANGTGMRYLTWDFLELSAVTIPANAEANIVAVKRFDQSPQSQYDVVAEALVKGVVLLVRKATGRHESRIATLEQRLAALEAKEQEHAKTRS